MAHSKTLPQLPREESRASVLECGGLPPLSLSAWLMTTDGPYIPRVGQYSANVSLLMAISDLPALNATLNFISTIFIATGWYMSRRGLWRQHIACMIAAITTSALFLVSYVTYHYARGGQSTQFTGQGIVRPIYFAILISHILLAFIILPLVIATVVPVFRRRWEKHKRLGRWTMPIWLYVSVTGVLVYLMLYRWFPAP